MEPVTETCGAVAISDQPCQLPAEHDGAHRWQDPNGNTGLSWHNDHMPEVIPPPSSGEVLTTNDWLARCQASYKMGWDDGLQRGRQIEAESTRNVRSMVASNLRSLAARLETEPR